MRRGTDVRYYGVKQRAAAAVPGYASVARASEILHLAPRSVRDLIYRGRLPSLRVGRLHYIKAADLDLERRRRLGLPLLAPRAHVRRPRTAYAARRKHADQARVDPALRQQRAAERAALVRQWAARHAHPLDPQLPFVVLGVTTPTTCASCGREVRRGRILEIAQESRLCLACGRRALLDWADQRRREAVAARQLSQSFGQPTGEPVRAVEPRGEAYDTRVA